MRAWDTAYADAMQAVHQAAPADRDARAVYVEAIMDMTPWRMWDLKTATPYKYARTEEAIIALYALPAIVLAHATIKPARRNR